MHVKVARRQYKKTKNDIIKFDDDNVDKIKNKFVSKIIVAKQKKQKNE